MKACPWPSLHRGENPVIRTSLFLGSLSSGSCSLLLLSVYLRLSHPFTSPWPPAHHVESFHSSFPPCLYQLEAPSLPVPTSSSPLACINSHLFSEGTSKACVLIHTSVSYFCPSWDISSTHSNHSPGLGCYF